MIRPFYSIIVPTFNASDTFDALLQSIYYQDFTNYELIVVDGCSTDNTLYILHNYGFNNIKLIVESDKGIYDAMNTGIKAAAGEWIIFMGADDSFCSKSVLSMSSSKITNLRTDVDVVFGRYKIGAMEYENFFDWRLLFTNSINHQSIFYSSRIFHRYRYPLQYIYASDYHLNLYLYLSNHLSAKINVLISVYSTNGRSNSDSMISRSELRAVRRELLPNMYLYIEVVRVVRKFFFKLLGKS